MKVRDAVLSAGNEWRTFLNTMVDLMEDKDGNVLDFVEDESEAM